MAHDLPRFSTSRFRRGYSTTDVDAYLSSVFEAIAQGEPTPDIRKATFGTKLDGYDMQEFDAFLEDLRTGVARSDPPATVSGEDLPTPEFETVRVGGAYQKAEVDAFVASVFTAVHAGRPVPRIAEAAFTRTWRGGYCEHDVDDYLDTLAGLLGQ